MEGGKHVDVVTDQIVNHLVQIINREKKGKEISHAQVRKCCAVFVNATIEGPVFSSQTKELMTLPKSKHGSKPILSEEFLKSIEKSGVVQLAIELQRLSEKGTGAG